MADGGSSWYFTRKEIEENSPSRRDGIDLKKETDFRKSYSSFLCELGVKLFVPQVMIATAIVFCHRFFLRQSHAKHDRFKIATACMYLASKVEGTPRPLRNFVVISFQIIHKKDPKTHHSIVRKKEVYEEQKDLMLQEEKLVIETLEFDFNICHPYKPLLEAIKKVKGVANQNALTQVAWNFVNDGFRTSLCLQMKPHKIAAGSLFLAAKFLKIQLHWDGRKTWWQELSVTPRQLEEVSHQLLELYEQDRAPTLRASQDSGSGENAISSDSSVDQANVHNENQNPQGTDFEKLEPEINYNRQSTKQGQLSPGHSTSMVDFEPQDQQEQGNIGERMETLELNNVEVSQPAPTTNNCGMILKIKVEVLEKRRNSGPN